MVHLIRSRWWSPNGRRLGLIGDTSRGGGGCSCNTLVLALHFALALHEHKHHPFIHEHKHMNSIYLLYVYLHEMLNYTCICLMPMLGQCKWVLFGNQNNLDILRMKNGTKFVFMSWPKMLLSDNSTRITLIKLIV